MKCLSLYLLCPILQTYPLFVTYIYSVNNLKSLLIIDSHSFLLQNEHPT